MADVNNVAALNGNGYCYNPWFNSYMTQSTLGLYDDCFNPMGMNGSIFGGGFMPMFGGGMNYDDYFKQMADYQNFTSRYQLQTVQNQRSNELAINAPMEAIQGTAAVLNEKIVANEQEQIQSAWQSYLTAVKNAYPSASDSELLARAKTHYQQIYNTPLNDDIRKYGNGSFTHGLYKVLSFGLYQNKSAEQNISDLTGQPVGKMEKLKTTTGMAVGGSLIAGTGYLAFKNRNALLSVAKKCWPVAAILAVGTGIAALFNK